MMTPNSAATPASAMKPTPVATEKLNPIQYRNHTPPVSANGSVAMMSAASATRWNVRYSSRKIISSVAGTTSFSRALARSMNSNWPE